MCLCNMRGERGGERRVGGQFFRHSVDLLPKVAKGVALQAVWGTERVGREGGVLYYHYIRSVKHKEGRGEKGVQLSRG